MTLTERAVEALRLDLIAGRIGRDTPLTERAAAAHLGMSRTPVRSALQALEREGLLDYAAHRGFEARPVDPARVAGAYEVRAVLEGLACRRLGEAGAAASLLNALRRHVDEGADMLSARTFDAGRWRAMNSAFHAAILSACGNDTLARAAAMAERIPLATTAVIADLGAVPDPARLAQAQADHAAIVAALARGHGARAEARMREHVTVAGELVVAQLVASQAPQSLAT